MRLFVMLALLVGSTASAKEKAPAPKKGLSGILKTLDWGTSSLEVIKALEAEVEARYAKSLEKADTLVIDKIMRKKRAEKKKVRKGLVRFDGRKTGYEASLISDDFRANNGEAMIRVDDGPAQRYYFFKDEQLYKVLVVYSTAVARRTKFPAFVSKAARKYGRPVKKETSKTDKALTGAVWRDDQTELRVRDRGLYGTYTMAFLQAGRGVEIENARIPSADGAKAVVSAQSEGMIADIMGGGDGASADVVDQLTGVEHKVNLNLGQEDYQPVRRAPEPAPSRARKTRKAQRKKTRRKAPEADFAPTPTGSDDIVY
jgi:hypothetical protein